MTNREIVVRLPRVVLLPSNLQTRIKYAEHLVVNNAGGHTFASNTFIINGLFDVDQLLGSTAIAGFTEMMSIYQNFRVISGQIRCQICNNEAFPLFVGSVLDPNVAIPTNTLLITEFANKWSKTHLLASKGGNDMYTFIQDFNCMNLFGSSAYLGDVSNFLGTASSNPATKLLWAIGINGNSNLVNGASIGVTIDFLVEWSNVKLLTG